MKKWWITLAALVLLLIPSVAMAGNEIGFYCFNCRADRTGIKSDTYEYSDQYAHIQRIICKECNYKGMSIRSAHTETIAATCQSPAYCALCKSYYGNPNPDNHNWSEWQPHMFSPNLHYRYCQNPGCSASESEAHDGNSNCVTSATCSKCHTIYKDTTKHVGPFTYTYEKIDESFHKRIETCTACGNKTGNQVETKHEEEHPANCTYGATCKVCMYEYGEPNPDNHSWSNWIYGNENQHYRFCIHNELHNQYADHRGDATCIVSMPCLDCGYSYKDPDKHQGGTDFDYTYVSDTEHKVTVTCGGCHGEIKTYQEGHSEHTPATCSSRAICAKCSTPFGDLAPNNHIGEATTTYVKTSESQHTEKIKYSDCGHTVDGASTDHTETTAATCTDAAYCGVCESNYGKPDPNAHIGTPTTTYVKTSETQHTEKIKYSDCGHTVDGVSTDHTETTAATCTDAAYCDVCKSSYGEPDPDAHDLVQHDAQAPTCYKIGWNAYEACQREGCGYTTYVEKGTLVHWYGEWTPNADGTHSATCRYGCGYRRTVPCACFTYQLNGDPVAEYTLCPVCGEVNDGTRLTMAEGARAAALTRTLPGGEVVVRMGVLSGGEAVMSVAFESAGCLTKPTGRVKINLPAELLEGYALRLLAGDGTETELTFDVHKEEASFVLDFTDSPSAVRVIRLVPVA